VKRRGVEVLAIIDACLPNCRMRTAILVVAYLTIASVSSAQDDRRAIEYYKANFEKYLGKQVIVDVASSTREDMGQFGDVAVFQVYTKGKTETGFVYAVVPKSDVDKFARRYAENDDYTRTRTLHGVFTKGPGFFYISVDGALLAKEEAQAPSAPE
jgi:hypothetical protein